MLKLLIILQIAVAPSINEPTFTPRNGLYGVGHEIIVSPPIYTTKHGLYNTGATNVPFTPPIYKSPHHYNPSDNEYWNTDHKNMWKDGYWENGIFYPDIDSLWWDNSGPWNGGWWPNITDHWTDQAESFAQRVFGSSLPTNWDSMTSDEKWNWLWDHTTGQGGNIHGEDRPWAPGIPIGSTIPLLFMCLTYGFIKYEPV